MSPVLGRYLKEKLCQRSTYILPAIVGTLINSYGQFLIPYLRGVDDPLERFLSELSESTGLVLFSIFVGYTFPFLVALYSAIMTRFGTRGIELKAQFPDNKPDPVFCADEDGVFLLFGNKTKEFVERMGFKTAVDLIGQEMWEKVISDVDSDKRVDIGSLFYNETADTNFLVRYSRNPEKGINVYLTELPKGAHLQLG